MTAIAAALGEGRVSPRLWMYANYHCNLRCTYCLTESAPGVPRRLLAPETMVAHAREARELGFTALGVTGSEPFLIDGMPDLIAELAGILPVVVLSNGTLFTGRRLAAIEVLAGLDVNGVRIATTLEDPEAVDPGERARLCALHRSLGVGDEDHVVCGRSCGAAGPNRTT